MVQRRFKGRLNQLASKLPGRPIVELIIARAYEQLASGNGTVLISATETSGASALRVLVRTTVPGYFVRSLVYAAKYLFEARHAPAIALGIE